jgi:nitrite reductase/ring-hydroxylating ferredoxin subunit
LAASNPARPASGLRLCALAELTDPGAKGFRFRKDEALFAGVVVRLNGRVAGYEDRCPHAGWPLAGLDDRFLTRTGEHILCAGHGALFRPENGLCVAGPCAGHALVAWPVEVRDGEVVTV